ncbi:hypothetical protein XACG117_1780112 [Xanthomonas citri pv. citri]|nr:hypothetical protein XACG117_1780112 [Xanthomonas citri pv. citri]
MFIRRSSRRLSGTPRQRVGSLPIHPTDVAFKLQPPDARPVGPLNSRGAEHAPAGTRMSKGAREWPRLLPDLPVRSLVQPFSRQELRPGSMPGSPASPCN